MWRTWPPGVNRDPNLSTMALINGGVTRGESVTGVPSDKVTGSWRGRLTRVIGLSGLLVAMGIMLPSGHWRCRLALTQMRGLALLPPTCTQPQIS